MRTPIAIAVLLFAAVGYAGAQAPLDHLIPCPTAVRAFASKDEAKIHEVAEYMDGTGIFVDSYIIDMTLAAARSG